MENIFLMVEYILLVITALSLIVGIIAPLFILLFSFLVNLVYRLKTGKDELILGHYGAPFVLMIGLVLLITSFCFALLIDVMITQYYYPQLIIY